jgi:hypothetical protein
MINLLLIVSVSEQSWVMGIIFNSIAPEMDALINPAQL